MPKRTDYSLTDILKKKKMLQLHSNIADTGFAVFIKDKPTQIFYEKPIIIKAIIQPVFQDITMVNVKKIKKEMYEKISSRYNNNRPFRDCRIYPLSKDRYACFWKSLKHIDHRLNSLLNNAIDSKYREEYVERRVI